MGKSEIWKSVSGFDGYEVSNFGRVRSYKKGSIPKVLHPSKDTSGYLHFLGRREGKAKSLLVHRLVALAFIENPKGYKEVNHKDEDKTNNKVDNLEWCDHLYNCRYGTIGKRIAAKNSRKVVAEFFDGRRKVFESAKQAGRELGVSQPIYFALSHKGRTAYGANWRYL